MIHQPESPDQHEAEQEHQYCVHTVDDDVAEMVSPGAGAKQFVVHRMGKKRERSVRPVVRFGEHPGNAFSGQLLDLGVLVNIDVVVVFQELVVHHRAKDEELEGSEQQSCWNEVLKSVRKCHERASFVGCFPPGSQDSDSFREYLHIVS